MRKHLLALLLLLFVASLAHAQKVDMTRSLEGTTWEGTVRAPNSDGSYTDYPYVFDFLPEGKVSWKWEGRVFTNGTWTQKGDSLRMVLNDGYSVWVGTIDGTHMTGTASNRLKHEWSWTLDQKVARHTH